MEARIWAVGDGPVLEARIIAEWVKVDSAARGLVMRGSLVALAETEGQRAGDVLLRAGRRDGGRGDRRVLPSGCLEHKPGKVGAASSQAAEWVWG